MASIDIGRNNLKALVALRTRTGMTTDALLAEALHVLAARLDAQRRSVRSGRLPAGIAATQPSIPLVRKPIRSGKKASPGDASAGPARPSATRSQVTKRSRADGPTTDVKPLSREASEPVAQGDLFGIGKP